MLRVWEQVPKGFWGRDGWRRDVRHGVVRSRDAWHRTRPAVHRGAADEVVGRSVGQVRPALPLTDDDLDRRLSAGRLDLVDGDLVFHLGRRRTTWSLTGRGRVRPVASAVLREPAGRVRAAGAQLVLLDADGRAVWRTELAAWTAAHPDSAHVLLACSGWGDLLARAGLPVASAVETSAEPPPGWSRAGWVVPRTGRAVSPVVEAVVAAALLLGSFALFTVGVPTRSGGDRPLTPTEVEVLRWSALVQLPFLVRALLRLRRPPACPPVRGGPLPGWYRPRPVVGRVVDGAGAGDLVALIDPTWVQLPRSGPGSARALRLTLHRDRHRVRDASLDVLVEPAPAHVRLFPSFPHDSSVDGSTSLDLARAAAEAVDLPLEVKRSRSRRAGSVPPPRADDPRGWRWLFVGARVCSGLPVGGTALVVALVGNVAWSTTLWVLLGLVVAPVVETALMGRRHARHR